MAMRRLAYIVALIALAVCGTGAKKRKNKGLQLRLVCDGITDAEGLLNPSSQVTTAATKITQAMKLPEPLSYVTSEELQVLKVAKTVAFLKKTGKKGQSCMTSEDGTNIIFMLDAAITGQKSGSYIKTISKHLKKLQKKHPDAKKWVRAYKNKKFPKKILRKLRCANLKASVSYALHQTPRFQKPSYTVLST